MSDPSLSAPDTGGAAGRRGRRTRRRLPGASRWVVALFLAPALVLLGALVVYPIGYSIERSLMDAANSAFVGLDNYRTMFTTHTILVALRNNAVWVVVAPVVATALGLVFAVLTERVRWGTVFKLVVFMPMAISMLAAGIIFRLVYDQDPAKGVANAITVSVHDAFTSSTGYPGASARPPSAPGGMKAADGGYTTVRADLSKPVPLALIGVSKGLKPDAGQAAAVRSCRAGTVCGTVWFDFAKGGGGTPGRVDRGDKALTGMTVQAVAGGKVVAHTTSRADGTFAFSSGAVPHGARLRLPESDFHQPFNGVTWLGPSLITPAIIGSYVWIWAGFAMVLISAGLAGIPRELLEAARVDGANEWQVFRRITVPVLMPVLVVVTVTLMINVLKIFDLVWIIAPGSSQQDANVLALQLYISSFGSGNNQGVGSALGVFLLLLVIPVMWFNIRRFRKERDR